MNGMCIWTDGETFYQSEIRGAEWVKDSLKNEYKLFFEVANNGLVYSVNMRSAPQEGWLRGIWVTQGMRAQEGTAQAKIHTSLVDGSLVLDGTWKESNTSYRWIVTLA